MLGAFVVSHNFKDVGQTEKSLLSLTVRNNLHERERERERERECLRRDKKIYILSSRVADIQQLETLYESVYIAPTTC